jgi:hypothetical protein
MSDRNVPASTPADVSLEHPPSPRPVKRPVKWGLAGGLFALSRYDLRDDEALVLTLDPLSVRYVGIAYNWLDTGGLPTGSVVARWELLAERPVTVEREGPEGESWVFAPERNVVEGAVRKARVVTLDEVAEVIPTGHERTAAGGRHADAILRPRSRCRPRRRRMGAAQCGTLSRATSWW